jgi:hypothetical protein
MLERGQKGRPRALSDWYHILEIQRRFYFTVAGYMTKKKRKKTKGQDSEVFQISP